MADHRTNAQSPAAQAALALVVALQERLCQRLTAIGGPFAPSHWLRDEGRHGGGTRWAYAPNAGDHKILFNRASLNASQVHYDDEPKRALASATALSCIVHPDHPRWPSLHLHISWTEMKVGPGYWRLMADLNPAIFDAGDRENFMQALRQASGDLADDGLRQGDRYFFIPALKRHRGVAHFYLEQYRSDDWQADRQLARDFGERMIDCYASILDRKRPLPEPSADERNSQLRYHTAYLFQVLTLDRGTTSGLLVHDQNDLGILGSLPSRIDRDLLASWQAAMDPPQDQLLAAIVAQLPADGRVGDEQKLALCRVMRQHYAAYPSALALQAQGDIVPPTVNNHLS